jgi:hypothetical protein
MRASLGVLKASLVSLAVASSVLLAAPNDALAVGGEGEGWPSFNESDGCGSPWVRGPNVESTGSMDLDAGHSTLLRGPAANFFGRTARDAYTSTLPWNVPMSDGEVLAVHERMAPAIEALDSNLFAAISNGLDYGVFKAYTFSRNSRTIRGGYRVSQHGFANAIDVNTNANLYSGANVLITDMPPWFVKAWTDAGFCWGGNWIESKDAMHFSWRGPLFTPGVMALPASVPPLTSQESFTRLIHAVTVPGTLMSTTARLLMDADADGAADVVNISSSGTGQIIDVLSARAGYNGCAVTRYISPTDSDAGTVIHGDWNRDGAQDIWMIDDSSGVKVTALLNYGGFQASDPVSVTTDAGDAYLAADHNVDGWADLYVLRHDGVAWSVEIFNGADRFTTVLATGSVIGPADLRFTAVDRNLDHTPDLFGIGSAQSLIADGASGFVSVESVTGFPGAFDDIAGTDFDGDGRHDIAMLTGDSLRVYAGNSALPGVTATSWFEWPRYDCSGFETVYPYMGRFSDDDGSVHEKNIDEIARRLITLGCNPPISDRFCPRMTITRGQLAAFLRRALELPPGDTNTFSDDNESIFEGDIESLVGAGIVVSCDVTGTLFCPSQLVSREVTAQFLVAAFGYPPSDTDAFIDDDESPHENDINSIAAVGVTLGCNPPTNDNYCPDLLVTRAQMASFMIRALAQYIR